MNKDDEKQEKNMLNIIHGIITGILIPVGIYMNNKIDNASKELAEYKVVVAQELGNRVYRADLDRLENKIDDLRNLFISEMVKEKHK